ncbi:MAG: isocitrate/isopropylmalate family dehydrogenase [Candidatus Tenebribacter burtonii]|jgi:3-isopropylmalate dehydrogenase|nr:isocitrate/isopropylmalate family dehydrogenase [Candidatus Tenebribacter burtonii]
MSKRTIVTMPGDGIGKVVLDETLRVLDAVGFEAQYVHADIGWKFWCKEGNPLPQRTLDLLEKHKISLFGAITSKPKSEAAKELDPKLADKGFVYYSPIVGLRQHFQLDICQRPCKTFSGNPLNFIRRGPNDTIEEPKVDVVVFRQNTEGLYGGVEWTDPSDQVYNAFMTHPKFVKNFSWSPKDELAISTRIFTKKYSERIIRIAFEYARKFGYKRVTLCEKPNVIRETSGMMLAICREMEKEYEGIQFNYTNIDAQMMWMTKNPETYGIIIAGNMFGDIVSDGFAGLIGGLGFACSANIGKEIAIFEPTHGSAPKYEKLDPSIVNPIAMILSACMMLDHIGEIEKATKIRNAIAKVVKDGKVRAYDMLKLRGSQEVLKQGAASTTEMTDAIIAEL